MAASRLTADCYSARERASMERSQQVRARLLRPLLKSLTSLRVTPGWITAASLATGLLFWPAWNWSPLLACGLLALHVALDGLDGPLARWQGVASARGSFTDTVCDQFVLATVVLTLTTCGRLPGPSAGAFLFLYTLVVAFAMVRNALGAPYSWLLRPRFLVYLAIPVDVWLAPGILSPLCLGLSTLLLFKAGTGVLAIRRLLN